jgi:HK97 family phage prohead protease
VVALHEDDHGLAFLAELLDTPRAAEVAEAVASGATSEVSVAYSHEVAHRGDDGHSHVTDLDLLEISIVQWGSNPKTSVEIAPAVAEEEEEPSSAEPAGLTDDDVLAAILAARS